MKKKTAIMELIEALEDFAVELDKKYDGDPWVKRGVYIAINEAKDRLEKEKEQMVLFSVNMSQRDGSNTGIDILEDEAIAYYKQTYKQD